MTFTGTNIYSPKRKEKLCLVGNFKNPRQQWQTLACMKIRSVVISQCWSYPTCSHIALFMSSSAISSDIALLIFILNSGNGEASITNLIVRVVKTNMLAINEQIPTCHFQVMSS